MVQRVAAADGLGQGSIEKAQPLLVKKNAGWIRVFTQTLAMRDDSR